MLATFTMIFTTNKIDRNNKNNDSAIMDVTSKIGIYGR
jgi:hypothetical protein